ncbi:hypothetical protein GKR48_06530 [Providencia sp. wls1943]|uniref:hypothetical protein n=1 Tax=Providencia sp. wls1943 TaxID=2675150 RepID=UPI0012B51B30|nr:hypothetical protein [Providencia sp. wls1943]MTB66478.1 hypothetical protein [Providencia sp. wls1943]
MAKNEFLPFGIAEGANVLSNLEYERLAARFNGFVSGVAKSKELNTVWRQSSVMSSALAQFIVDSDNKDLLDNGDIAGIKNRLVAAIKQTISGVGYVTTSAMNLELNKKMDKANISGVKGNDNDKVPSLNLFTTEVGKLASIGYSYSKIESDGRYQPKGDYVTSQALSDGLSKKFDKAGGKVEGGITATGNIMSTGDVIQVVNAKNNQSIQMDVTNDGLVRINSRVVGGTTATHLLPEKSGEFMQLGDYGFAGRGLLYNYSQSALETALLKDSTLSQIFRNDTTNTLTYRYSPSLLMRTGDTSALISIDVDTANVRATSVLLTNGTRKTNELYGTANTKVDRNGYLRTASNAEELIGVPIGGSVLWNGVWDENDPLAEFFWPNEGRSFSASAYPVAAKRFPSLKLPDDRGYAIRIADNGRGKDPGRTVGTYQEDAMMNLTGEFTARTDSAGVATGVFTKGNAGQTMSQGSNNTLGTVSFNAGNQVPTANEFRMKNVAKILITRMK